MPGDNELNINFWNTISIYAPIHIYTFIHIKYIKGHNDDLVLMCSSLILGKMTRFAKMDKRLFDIVYNLIS